MRLEASGCHLLLTDSLRNLVEVCMGLVIGNAFSSGVDHRDPRFEDSPK
jgi:hypothetical protein